MRNFLKTGRALALVPLLALAGCGGGEPSEDEMRGALQAQIDQATKAAGGRAGIVLHEFKKLSCAKPDGSTAYVCSVTIRIEGPLSDNAATTEMKFTKGPSGWVVVQ